VSCYDRTMIARLSAVGLGLLWACFLGCGRTDIDGPFAAASTIPIMTGAGGSEQSTGAGGAGNGTAGGSEPGPDGDSGSAGARGSNTGEAGTTRGEAGNDTGEAGSSSGGAGSDFGGHAGSAGQGGSPGTGAAGSAGGSPGGAGGSSGVGNACNPVAQNCGPGLRCDLPDSGPLAFECVMDVGGSGAEGQICREAGQDCAKGATCIQTVDGAGTPIGPARCFVFCNSRADCPRADRCVDARLMPDVTTNGAGNIRTGICAPRP
jgi:hypothetical protein